MKNNNRDYTELQLHYLDLDEYICENIYPINNIVFTEKINWLKGIAIAGGAIGLGFLVKFIWESIAKGNVNQKKIKKAKDITKEQKEKNKKKKSEVNLNPEQEQKLDEIDKASAAEIKNNIVPAFEQSDKTVPTEEISSNNPPNDAQQNNENPINPDEQASKTVPEKTEEELQNELTKLEQKNKESEKKISELKAQNGNIAEKIHQLGQNNINKIISDIGSLEKKVEAIEEKQVQIFSQDQHKDLEDKQIDQDKIKSKPLPVETIKENYDESFDNFMDLYTENMKIVDFTFKYISYHYEDLKRISIEYNKNNNSSIMKYSPLKDILVCIYRILYNLFLLICLFLKINIKFNLSQYKSIVGKSLMDPDHQFNIISDDSSTIMIYEPNDLLTYAKLDENSWLRLYIDLFKDENYNKIYCVFEKGVFENIIQKHYYKYKDTTLINDIDASDGFLSSEREYFTDIKSLSKKVTESTSNLTNNEMYKTFIKLRKEQLKSYLIDQASKQNKQ